MGIVILFCGHCRVQDKYLSSEVSERKFLALSFEAFASTLPTLPFGWGLSGFPLADRALSVVT